VKTARVIAVLSALLVGAAWSAVAFGHAPDEPASAASSPTASPATAPPPTTTAPPPPTSVAHDHDAHGPRDVGAVWDAASPAERAAATALVEETTAATARYQDVAVALADGFRPNPNQHGRMVHYPNVQNRRDDHVLDPNAVEGLVYLRGVDGTLRLVAALYTTRGGSLPPAPGGGITTWHSHTPGCAHPSETPGCEDVVRMYMLHVWLGPGVHDAFADTFVAAR
jgi:hypothetical protein